MKLLLIDDNKDITTMFSKYFTQKGHPCTVCNNSHNAIDMITTGHYDAILLDLAMPEFTGKDFLDSLIQNGKIETQKIIVLTAMPLGDVIIKGARHGICKVVQKPFKLDTLMKTLESLNIVA